jgi:pimeloyl-ACP methyl ester carboxylesterase
MRVLQFVRQQKSTIGRSLFGLWSQVAPASAERYAADRFGRPDRGQLAPSTAPVLEEGHPFQVESGTEQLAAWEWGNGPTLLLVHGWNGRASQMGRFVAPFVAAGFHVVAFDQPAHGRSTGTRTNLPEMARAVQAVARKVAPVYGVIAHSLGATATALAISRGLAVERTVLIAPPAEVEHYTSTFAASLGLPAARAAGMLAQIERNIGVPASSLDVRRVAPAQRVPLLVMHDAQDREVPFAHGQAIANAWPGARLERLSKLGHRRMLADAKTIEAAVRFIRGTSAISERSEQSDVSERRSA